MTSLLIKLGIILATVFFYIVSGFELTVLWLLVYIALGVQDVLNTDIQFSVSILDDKGESNDDK